jgi:hypothetical protein
MTIDGSYRFDGQPSQSTTQAVVENPDISDITGVERDQLDEWENKFKVLTLHLIFLCFQ